MLDKLPVLGEGFGLFVLVTIPDLPEFACKAELAEDLEFASLQKHAVVLMSLDVAMPGYSRERELMVKQRKDYIVNSEIFHGARFLLGFS